MHLTCLSVPQCWRWLMIVSRQTAVLPVFWSPMISSRWPRPMLVIESMALMPVSSGSRTDWRWTTEGACTSSGRVDHAAEEAVADRDRQDLAGALDLVALFHAGGVAEDDAADLAHVQVERHPHQPAGELQQLVGHAGGQPLDPGDAVAGLGDASDLLPGH